MEAAFILPIFFFAMVVIMGFFMVIQAQMEVEAALTKTARLLAVSYGSNEEHALPSLPKGKALFLYYMKEADYKGNMVHGGWWNVILSDSNFDGDYVTLTARYQVDLPIQFWSVKEIPITQCVVAKKWTGSMGDHFSTEDGFVYVTPEGEAYHTSPECHYLDLSIQCIPTAQLSYARSEDGCIYKPCNCYNKGSSSVFVTAYGVEYHSDLNCPRIKRTIYRVPQSDMGNRHVCPKCGG